MADSEEINRIRCEAVAQQSKSVKEALVKFKGRKSALLTCQTTV